MMMMMMMMRPIQSLGVAVGTKKIKTAQVRRTNRRNFKALVIIIIIHY